MKSAVLAVVVVGCAMPSASEPLDARDAFVIDTLAADNYAWARRDPELVRDKLVKMQRDPFLWLRGTAAVSWRDAMAPSGDRAPTAFGDAASSRVLLVGDPHVENLGSYRAAGGAMSIEWDDFDAAGYGPYELDVRRLAASLLVATGAEDDSLPRAVAEGYAQRIADLAAGVAPPPLATGTSAYLDALIGKAIANGDAGKTLGEVAPAITDGSARAIAFGDIDPVAADGVIENTLEPVGPDADAWIARAIDAWSGGAARIKLQCRRLGSGVSSYAALRYYVVLEGPTPAPGDDEIVELKEERDGVIIAGVPRYGSAEWASPAARVVDAQRRMQSRPDTDALLGAAEVGALSLRIHDHADYQRGLDAADFAALAPDEQRVLATAFGALLASAHGRALTADGVRGAAVIAPLLAGKTAAFVAEVAALAGADAAAVRADFARMASLDLATLVMR